MPIASISEHFMYITMLLEELNWLLSKMLICMVELCTVTLRRCYIRPEADFNDSSVLVTRPFHF